MPYKIIYLDEAKQDVKDAKAWYKTQQKGLQKRFAAELIKAITRLQNNPEAYAIRYRNIRIIHPKKFPFGMHFYIDEAEQQIVITAIIHNYRDVNLLEERNL